MSALGGDGEFLTWEPIAEGIHALTIKVAPVANTAEVRGATITHRDFVSSSISSPTEPEPLAEDEDGLVDHWPAPIGRDAYIGPLGELVDVMAGYTEGDPNGLLMMCLAIVGNILGNAVYWRVGRTRHPALLYLNLVGASGDGKKGTVEEMCLGVAEALDPDWYARCVHKGGMSSGEAIVDLVHDRLVVNRKKGDKWVPEVVTEGYDDKRSLIVEGEFYQALGVMKRVGNTLSPVIREAWAGGKLETIAKTVEAKRKATHPHITIVGEITPDELHDTLGRSDKVNGFTNRFLWAMVRTSGEVSVTRNWDSSIIQSQLDEIKRSIHQFRNGGEMRLDADGAAWWETLSRELSKGRDGLAGEATKRARPYVLRIAMVYAVLDGASSIGTRHLEAALAVWTYNEDSVVYLFGDRIGNGNVDKLRDALILAGDKGMNRTEISELFSRNLTKVQIDTILRRLREGGMAVYSKEQTANGGRADVWRSVTPKRRYSLPPTK